MQVIADLQLHSRFSRAVSPQMTIPTIAAWAARKGIGLVATGDWTHPIWFREIEQDLEEVGNGLLRLKKDTSGGPLFVLATEISCIYSQGGKVRRIHTLLWVPSLASARKISQEMTKRGCNLLSDGRPIVGLTSIALAQLVLDIDPKALIIPAHAWTPWFSVFGGMSGFDSLDEAFGPYAKYIYAVETGLSSNPAMNWRIGELDHRSIVSFSDAHSGPKLGREATVFEISQSSGMSYQFLHEAIAAPSLKTESRQMNARIAYTIEFYPEEGKYHWSGHRSCNIRLGPKETAKNGSTCPVCAKPLTQGVEQRVSELAVRTQEDLMLIKKDNMMTSRAFPDRPGYVSLVPLQEIISECIGSPVASPKVVGPYMRLTDELGSEFDVLLQAHVSDIVRIAGQRVAEGVEKVRRGDLVIEPGYDGVFGKVKLWEHKGEKAFIDESKKQLSIF